MNSGNGRKMRRLAKCLFTAQRLGGIPAKAVVQSLRGVPGLPRLQAAKKCGAILTVG